MQTESMEARARRIIAEFAPLEDPIDRYRRLVALGDTLPGLPPGERTDGNRLPGCQFAVWLRVEHDPETDALRFGADSDARIVRGLAALILQVVDGHSPRDVAEADFDFLDTIGVRAQLSVQRGNGLASLIDEIRRRARAYLDDQQATR